MSIRRLNKELLKYPKDGPIRFVELIDDNISQQIWELRPSAGDSVAFEGSVIKVTVNVPCEYPFKPPEIALERTIFHPNVRDLGMCLVRLTTLWNPKLRINQIMEDVLNLIMYPNADNALNTEAAELYLDNRSEYIARAKRELTN